MNDTNTEGRLRTEIDELRRRLEEQQKLLDGRERKRTRPSALALVGIGLLIAGLIVAGLFAGYLPRQRREEVLAAESKAGARTLPVVNVVKVTRSESRSELILPGNIQAVTEGPVLARTSGYLKRRLVDIGDRVKQDQPLAEIEAPELDQQIRQARAALEQANNAAQQADAALKQGQANENLARVTQERFKNLFEKGVVSRQENDNYQAQWAAQQANVEALEKAIGVARSSAGAVRANLDRLSELKN